MGTVQDGDKWGEVGVWAAASPTAELQGQAKYWGLGSTLAGAVVAWNAS